MIVLFGQIALGCPTHGAALLGATAGTVLLCTGGGLKKVFGADETAAARLKLSLSEREIGAQYERQQIVEWLATRRTRPSATPTST